MNVFSQTPTPAATLAVRLEPCHEVHIKCSWQEGNHRKGKSEAAEAAKRGGAEHLSNSKRCRNAVLPRAGKGKPPKAKRFGKVSKRWVKNCCQVLHEKYGKKAVFGTLTIPGSGRLVEAVVSMWSRAIVEHFSKWLRRKAPDGEYVYVWEYQRRGMLHLHIGLGCNDMAQLRAVERGWKAYSHVVLRLISKASGVDIYQNAKGGSWAGLFHVLKSNCRPVVKNLGRYMSKYLSKGSVQSNSFPPSSWWGAASSLRNAVRLKRRLVWTSSDNLDALFDLASALRILCRSFQMTSFDWSHRMSSHGWSMIMYPSETDSQLVFNILASSVREWASALELASC